MRLRLPTCCVIAVMLAACSAGGGEGPPRGMQAVDAGPPELRVPDVLPGAVVRTSFGQPLPGQVTPSFEYHVVAEVRVDPHTRSVSLETPLGAREATDRLVEDFRRAGLQVSLDPVERQGRKGGRNHAPTYHAGVEMPGRGADDREHVGITARDREGQPAVLTLLVRAP